MAIYLYDRIDEFSDDLFRRSLILLPEERQKKATAFRQKNDQKLSVLGYVLLNYGLKYEYGITENIELSYSAKGKPFLSYYPQIHFNISHCRSSVICGLHTAEIGVDIETILAYDPQLAEYVCNEREWELINKSDNKALTFTKIWTQKESLMKKTGIGLTDDLKKIETVGSEAIVLVDPGEAYVFSIAGMSLVELGLRTELFK